MVETENQWDRFCQKVDNDIDDAEDFSDVIESLDHRLINHLCSRDYDASNLIPVKELCRLFGNPANYDVEQTYTKRFPENPRNEAFIMPMTPFDSASKSIEDDSQSLTFRDRMMTQELQEEARVEDIASKRQERPEELVRAIAANVVVVNHEEKAKSADAEIQAEEEKLKSREQIDSLPCSRILQQSVSSFSQQPESFLDLDLSSLRSRSQNPLRDRITSEDFDSLAQVKKVDEDLKSFTKSKPVHVLLFGNKPQVTVLPRDMFIRYMAKSRYLILHYNSKAFYIRLYDLKKIVATENCLKPFERWLNREHRSEWPVALYFPTSEFPMVIIFESLDDKNAFVRICSFLRECLATGEDLEVVLDDPEE